MQAPFNPDDIRQTLQVLDGLPKAAPPADFEKNLFERIESLSADTGHLWIPWVKWAVAAMLILSLTNGYIIYRQQQESGQALVSQLWTQDSQSDSDILPDFTFYDDKP